MAALNRRSGQRALRSIKRRTKRFGAAGDDSNSDRSGRDQHDRSKSTAARNSAERRDNNGRHLAVINGIEAVIVTLAKARIGSRGSRLPWRHTEIKWDLMLLVD